MRGTELRRGVCACVSVCTWYLAGLEIKLSQWAFRLQLLLSRQEMRVFGGGCDGKVLPKDTGHVGKGPFLQSLAHGMGAPPGTSLKLFRI